MSIKIKWVDRNAVVDGFRLYRSLTPIDDTALPAPLTTLAANVFEYIDTTALRNTVYYYKIGAYLGAQETLSLNKPMGFMPYTGPGPQTLLKGDIKAGFYGEMLFDELIGYDDFRSIHGITAWSPPATKPTKWLKFVCNGKILFFPDQGAFAATVSPTQIYQAGLLYGTNDDTIYNTTLKSNNGLINQVRPLTIRGDVFIPRLPIGRADRTLVTTDTASTQGGELDTCLGMMFLNRGRLATFPLQWGDYVNDAAQFFTSDSYTTANLMARGTAIFDQTNVLSVTGTHASFTYRPVLELVL